MKCEAINMTEEKTLSVEVRLFKPFVDKFNELQKKYGKELAEINGFSSRQLSYTDFIDNFVDSSTVADASVDGNANVGQKDIVTLINEMPKPHQKLLAFNKIYYEIGKKYGSTAANEWLEREWIGLLHMHDANTSSFVSYCFAYDLKDLAEKGLFFIDNFNAEPPKHLVTFVDFVKEFVQYNSNRTSGAVGLPNLIPYMYYFWSRDVKNNYYTDTPEKYAKQNIQRLIYALNQPYTRNGIQSAFTNTSEFDRPYLEALFGGSVFPDGAFMIDEIEDIMSFQKMFLETMAEIRSKNMMTFPVNTISLLRKNGKFEDEEFARWACEHNRKWNDSNLFIDDSVTSLSNCCFDGDQMTLTKSSNGVNFMSFKDLFDSPYKDTKRNFTIFHNGSWVKGKVVRRTTQSMYKVTTSNNKIMYMTFNHINPTLRGDVQASDLTTNDYLLFNTEKLNAIHEVDKRLSYEQGYLIGMYIGDGSMQDEYNNHTPTINLSINKEKYLKSKSYIEKAISDIGASDIVRVGQEYNNVLPIRITSNIVHDFIRQYVFGKYCFEKSLNMDCLLQSDEFRRGIIDGYYCTDGGNSNRIYTTSKEMAECIEAVLTSLGRCSIIDITDRTDEDVIIRDKYFSRNYPLYCIRWYADTNRRKLDDVYIKRNNSIYFKIKSIEQVDGYDKEYVYCFQIDNENEPYFTLPNGLITHNCRLKSDITDLYFNSIGGTALKVGSVKVNTVNLARIALESETEEKFYNNLRENVYYCLISLDCVRNIIKRNVDKGLLKNFSLNLIDFDHLYNTIGVIGGYEAIRKFGYVTHDKFDNTFYTDKAIEFGKNLFDVIHKTKEDFTKNVNYKINVEQIPGETAAARLMKKDLIFYPETTITDLPLYGNQFIPLGIKTTLQHRIEIASLFDKFCNGGSILHINIETPFDTFDKAWNMLNYVADKGVTYFAFNTKIKACKHNHAFYGDICPECGEPVYTEYSRIVGFYTPVRTYSKERKVEYALREWEKNNEE